MTVHGRDAYPTFSEKVAALMHSIARNGSLVDGNKRLAWGAGRVFCIMNRRDLIMNEFEAERLIHSISKGEIGVKAISELIKPLIRKI
jgi:death-on-curing protein